MTNKCVCIKTYRTNPAGGKTKYAIFIKDKIYEYTDNIFVSREYPEGYNVQFSKGEYIYFRKYQDPLAEKRFGLFDTYFKTIKDIRREKLNKINETNG